MQETFPLTACFLDHALPKNEDRKIIQISKAIFSLVTVPLVILFASKIITYIRNPSNQPIVPASAKTVLFQMTEAKKQQIKESIEAYARDNSIQAPDGNDLIDPPPSQVLDYLFLGTQENAGYISKGAHFSQKPIDEVTEQEIIDLRKKNTQFLREHGITFIASINGDEIEVPSEYPKLQNQWKNYERRYFCLGDKVPQSRVKFKEGEILNIANRIYDFIETARSQGKKIFIHCNTGVSRSPTMVIFYLMKRFDLSFKTAFKYVQLKRRIACPGELFQLELSKLTPADLR